MIGIGIGERINGFVVYNLFLVGFLFCHPTSRVRVINGCSIHVWTLNATSLGTITRIQHVWAFTADNTTYYNK